MNRVSKVERKKGEAFESFLRRFKTETTKTGVQLQARKVQFFESGQSRNVRRKHAVKRARRQAVDKFMIKIGRKAPEETTFRKK